ncbi:MAG: PAS domain-containing protein [Anaerolineae bacterium]|nr:PAS domain-containing protein [Anaerolineae bacterium]
MYWSEESYRIWGLEPDTEPTYAIFVQAVHPDEREALQALIQHTIQTGEPYETEIRFVRPNGEVRYVFARGRLEHDAQGQPEKLLGTSLDITERKQVELEREKLIKDLQAARRIAEENSRLKSEFLATMSHELRTPMNAIEGFTSIMLNRIGGAEFNPRAEDFLRRIQGNSRRLLGLINNFLDLSRIESGRMELAEVPFAPQSLLAEWEKAVGVLAESKTCPWRPAWTPSFRQP